MAPSPEEESGRLSPISSIASTSTAVEQQTNGLFFSPSRKSCEEEQSTPTTRFVVPRPNPSRPRERMSFSSAQNLPVLEPSASPFRRRFDFILLWILQTLTWLYVSIAAIKRRVANGVLGIWYNWHAWKWCGKYMIERDIAALQRVPRHVAVILNQRKSRREYDADEIIRRTVDVAIWCACAGISIVTVYEPTGSQKAMVIGLQQDF
jgi:dehydrodolichyl diphosphate syntase complex subunit NUS1